jgi:hypothetical protein
MTMGPLSRLMRLLKSGFEESAGRDGFHHYMAFDAGRPIATAALVQFEDVGYLTNAQAFLRNPAAVYP